MYFHIYLEKLNDPYDLMRLKVATKIEKKKKKINHQVFMTLKMIRHREGWKLGRPSPPHTPNPLPPFIPPSIFFVQIIYGMSTTSVRSQVVQYVVGST